MNGEREVELLCSAIERYLREGEFWSSTAADLERKVKAVREAIAEEEKPK